ncbi:MAG: M20/M25/M40 family metallo-hydrolase [Oscillospiraceae bacterium]|nr:M20/M25/M40 family metallo-hydrolase [Oscillospiraceae bacterium]
MITIFKEITMWDKLAKLSNTIAPSGYESKAAELAAEYLRQFTNDVQIDTLGNVIGMIPSPTGVKTLLIDAHIDEIGVMVSGHEGGFLRFVTLGGIDPRMLMAREIRFLTGHYGVVACLPPHIQQSSDADKCIPVEDLYIDIGLDDASCIPIGTVGVFDTELADWNNGCVIGKALDDRAAFLIILRALELIKSPVRINIAVVASVQEEAGHRGAKTAAFGLNPDLCIALDVTHARTPDAPEDRTFVFGGGPVIGVAPSIPRSMSDTLKKLAKDNGIPYQIEVMSGNTGTNDWAFQTTREGIPAACLLLPLKYMHSPIEMFNKDDFENTAKLLAAFIEVQE